MVSWLLAVLAGFAAAGVQYGRRLPPRAMVAPALLRGAAVLLLVAALTGAPLPRAPAPAPESVFDASESWRRARDDGGWRAARDSARAAGAPVLRFGDSLRGDTGDPPRDHASALRPAVDAAAARGRAVVVVTDGELDDPDVVDRLPAGSRLIVLPAPDRPDLAVAALEAPPALAVGDTARITVTVVSGAGGSAPATLALWLEARRVGGAELPASPPYTERSVAMAAVLPSGAGRAVLRAVLTSARDAEPRNDTLAVGVDITGTPAAVFVSTAPDYDAREALAALRGVTALRARGFVRVAPGAWRAEGTLAPVAADAVREAVREAPLVVLHGDTAVFGAPRSLTRGALLLFVPALASDGDWFASAAPGSPLTSALASLPFDSLPPLDVTATRPRGEEWTGLVARRGGVAGDVRPVLVGWDGPPRVAFLGASGLWRWRFRGGVRAAAYAGLLGSLYDWLAEGGRDRRAAVPDGTPVRAGLPVRWRRGAPADSVVRLDLARRDAPPRRFSVMLHFAPGATVAESDPLPEGVYDVSAPGGPSLLVVNRSREWLPRRPTVRSGPVGSAPAAGALRSARDQGWLYLLVVVLLCGEWTLRRRQGLR